jgi:hypothetical protein
MGMGAECMFLHMLVSKPFIILDRIHVSLLQVAWLTYMQMFTIGGHQMPIEKMNVYAGVHAQLWELIILGCTPLTYFTEL